MRSWPLITLGLLAVAGVAASTTWQVTFDPGNPVDQIGQIVAQASSGDSIVVGPGTYYEHIDLQGKSLVMQSTDGHDATVLDGSQTISGRTGSVIYACPSTAANVVLSGFTVQGGTGGANEVGIKSGGGVCFWNHPSARAGHVEIRDCIVIGNAASSALDGYSGGIYFSNLDTTVIDGCSFQDNEASARGGSICVMSPGVQHVIRNCQFLVGDIDPSSGTAAYLEGGEFEINHNHFTSDGGSGSHWCIVAAVLDIHLNDNEFVALNGNLASRVKIVGLDNGDDFFPVEVRGNRVYADMQTADDVFRIVLGTGTISMVGNSFIGCRIAADASLGTPLQLSNNVFFHSPTSVFSHVGGIVTCNDIWPDPIVDQSGNFAFDRNVSEDPLFCDSGTVTFDVSAASVCAEGHSPEECGWIGAGRIGCSGTPVQPATWGRIKALFR